MKRILFVDDESNILNDVRRMLRTERHRWDMEFALGGEAALQACEKGRFDIVISDMLMPGMDGATLLARIRDCYPETARLVLSGYSTSALTALAIPLPNLLLSKPYDGAELRATIEQVLVQDSPTTASTGEVPGSAVEVQPSAVQDKILQTSPASISPQPHIERDLPKLAKLIGHIQKLYVQGIAASSLSSQMNPIRKPLSAAPQSVEEPQPREGNIQRLDSPSAWRYSKGFGNVAKLPCDETYTPGQFALASRDDDNGSKVDYFGSRNYSSVSGRFVNTDPPKATPETTLE